MSSSHLISSVFSPPNFHFPSRSNESNPTDPNGDDDDDNDIPGSPQDKLDRLKGPWFKIQFVLSIALGIFSFLWFSTLRNRWETLYKPRTRLRGFSPHEVHHHAGFFGWILPTLRTSEFTVLQIVGLDAVVLLNFFKASFYLFLTNTILAAAVLIPINYRETGTTEGVWPDPSSGPPRANASYLASIDSFNFNVSLPSSNSTNGDDGKGPIVQHSPPSLLLSISHLVFTYLFTILTLHSLSRSYARFITSRQLFSLEHSHSVPQRTVIVKRLPVGLRGEKGIAEYFEALGSGVGGMGHGVAGGGGRGVVIGGDGEEIETGGSMGVETVSIGREVGSLRRLLEKRTKALVDLERAWVKYLGNPVPEKVKSWDLKQETKRIKDGEILDNDGRDWTGDGKGKRNGNTRTEQLVDTSEIPVTQIIASPDGNEGVNHENALDHHRIPDEANDNEDEEARLIPPSSPLFNRLGKKRPTKWVQWWKGPFSKKVDALEWYAERFRQADEAVARRRKGRFRPTETAFVTFETMSSAQIAAQAIHYPTPGKMLTDLAPEPRDVYWDNLALSTGADRARRVLVFILFVFLLGFWGIPVSYLAQLLSFDSIQKVWPQLAHWIDESPVLGVVIHNSLPSLALIGFNALLPNLLEHLAVFQGLRARSFIEYSLMKKYFLFLLIQVVLVFVAASTFALVQDLADSPIKVLDKIAVTLPGARNFFVSYVMLQSLGIMPLQLTEFSVIGHRLVHRIFTTRTPRDFAELNAPPVLNLGTVYPQAMLIFTICLIFSMIAPLILVFGTIYFGMAYLVYKYKLLFVYYKPFESRGQAWPTTYVRLVWGLLLFQLFMLSIFVVQQQIVFASLMIPLMAATVYGSWKMYYRYEGLTNYVNLSQASEVQRGSTSDVVKLQKGHPVTRSQTNLNRTRYAHGNDSLYMVGKDARTDYSQPPISDMFPGILTTGRRRYGHPALFGSLPQPWLPQYKPEEIKGATNTTTTVLDLKRQWSDVKRAARRATPGAGRDHGGKRIASPTRSLDEQAQRAWTDEISGVVSDEEVGVVERIERGEGEDLGVVGFDSDEEADIQEEQQKGSSKKYRTYWHRRSGVFPDAPEVESDSEGSSPPNVDSSEPEGSGTSQHRPAERSRTL